MEICNCLIGAVLDRNRTDDPIKLNQIFRLVNPNDLGGPFVEDLMQFNNQISLVQFDFGFVSEPVGLGAIWSENVSSRRTVLVRFIVPNCSTVIQ